MSKVLTQDEYGRDVLRPAGSKTIAEAIRIFQPAYWLRPTSGETPVKLDTGGYSISRQEAKRRREAL